jgi:hypothetical protein
MSRGVAGKWGSERLGNDGMMRATSDAFNIVCMKPAKSKRLLLGSETLTVDG